MLEDFFLQCIANTHIIIPVIIIIIIRMTTPIMAASIDPVLVLVAEKNNDEKILPIVVFELAIYNSCKLKTNLQVTP